MEDLHEYFLQKMSGDEWRQVTKSYENVSLIEAGKRLERMHPGEYRVIDGNGIILWQGKGTLNNESAP